jgi:hypothetical protein
MVRLSVVRLPRRVSGRFTAVAMFSGLAGGAAGCGNILGVDDGTVVDGDLPGTQPVTDGTTGSSGSSSSGGTEVDSTVANTGADGTTDSTLGESADDDGSGLDAAVTDASADAGPADAAPENDCGPLTTTANCGACGVSCSSRNVVDAGCVSSPPGASCIYSCAAGWTNCNTAPPNASVGCECNTPMCCAGVGATPGSPGPTAGCETTHGDGLGNAFYDCEPLGTLTQQQATSACTAYVKTLGLTSSSCAPITESCTSHGVTATLSAVQATVNSGASEGSDPVWVYAASGAYAGLVVYYSDAESCTANAGAAAWQ